MDLFRGAKHRLYKGVPVISERRTWSIAVQKEVKGLDSECVHEIPYLGVSLLMVDSILDTIELFYEWKSNYSKIEGRPERKRKVKGTVKGKMKVKDEFLGVACYESVEERYNNSDSTLSFDEWVLETDSTIVEWMVFIEKELYEIMLSGVVLHPKMTSIIDFAHEAYVRNLLGKFGIFEKDDLNLRFMREMNDKHKVSSTHLDDYYKTEYYSLLAVQLSTRGKNRNRPSLINIIDNKHGRGGRYASLSCVIKLAIVPTEPAKALFETKGVIGLNPMTILATSLASYLSSSGVLYYHYVCDDEPIAWIDLELSRNVEDPTQHPVKSLLNKTMDFLSKIETVELKHTPSIDTDEMKLTKPSSQGSLDDRLEQRTIDVFEKSKPIVRSVIVEYLKKDYFLMIDVSLSREAFKVVKEWMTQRFKLKK